MKEIQILNNGESLYNIRTKINNNFETVKNSENIVYNPDKTNIVANNVQDAIDRIGNKINGYPKFAVNEGNYTNDKEDLLEYNGNTLSFKVGNTYPNLVATKGDGTTFNRSEIINEDLSSYEDGNYTIYCNETQTEILNSNLYEQVTVPEAPNKNDIWRNTNTNEVRRFDSNALTLVNVEGGANWTIFDKVPLGTVEKSGGTITNVNTWQYNRTIIATPTTYGSLRTAAAEDEVNCDCHDAGITPKNLCSLANYRKSNTSYELDDTVGCPYHHDLQLICTQSGTTSETSLDTHNVSDGYILTDGTVKWKVQYVGNKDVLQYKNITNCILEAPSGVFMQNSDGYYMVPKGTRFLSADGIDTNGNIKNLDVTLTSDVVISNMPTTSTGLHMFYLQSNDKTNWSYGYRVYSGQWFEQDTLPTVADATWYNTKDKIWRIIQTADGTGQWYTANCIPIALVNLNNGVINKIYWVNSVIDLIKNKAELANVDAVDLALPTTVLFNTLFQAPCNGKVFVWSRIEAAANVNSRHSSRDCVGYLNAATAETGITVNQEYTQVGTYTFNAPTTGWYNMILVGGGGTGGSGLNSLSVAAYWSGGSGACFSGQVYLTAGNHTITVGGANGASSIDGLVVAGGGGNGSGGGFNLQPTGGAGGTLSVTGQVQNTTIYSNGNAGTGATGGSHIPGGASLYNGWGSGAGSNGSPATGYAFISYQGSTSETTGDPCYVNYVSVDWDGSANTVTAIHDSTSWINIEKGQTIKFVANVATAQTDMAVFNAQFYPKKVEMKNTNTIRDIQ